MKNNQQPPHSGADMEPMADAEGYLRSLIDLNEHDDLRRLLDAALELIVGESDAAVGYIELYAQPDDAKTPLYWRGIQCSGETAHVIRNMISRGIIARAIAEGHTISTASAVTDVRFAELGSVRQNQIQAAMCVPIGDRFTIGVIYLQGLRAPQEFEERDRDRAELLARQLRPLVERLLPSVLSLPEELEALTKRRVEESLQRHDWNVSDAARELGVSRKFLYRFVGRGK